MTIEKMTEILISLFGMVGTLAAAIAAAISSYTANKTVKLTEAQINQSKENFNRQARPVLHLTSFEEEYKKPFQQRSFEGYSSRTKGFASDYSTFLSIGVVNLGGSSCRNININTKVLEFKEFFQQLPSETLDRFNEKFGFNISVDDIVLSEHEVCEGIYFQSDTTFGQQTNEILTEYLDYIIPLDTEEKKIQLPKIFTSLYDLMIFHNLSGGYIQLPLKLEVEINFEDFVGNTWTQTFVVKTFISHINKTDEHQIKVKLMPHEIKNELIKSKEKLMTD
jgi:hypothetical protein